MAFEYLAQYITFNSITEMDRAIDNYMASHYYNLTESERTILFKLASHSLEHTGACHLKASTIAESLKISTKTVYRSIKKLTELGIIEKNTKYKIKRNKRSEYLSYFTLCPIERVSTRDSPRSE